ncbi:vitamin K epoxide reductase family protein [Tersicoccus sp. MR15.9]|uniref:vitamin K epoxide reductase family protein n=1 Tax=Tersicoccus mangrovi TaxID=3121635 RepID=UPI002FE5695B
MKSDSRTRHAADERDGAHAAGVALAEDDRTMPGLYRRARLGWLYVIGGIIGFLAAGELVLDELALLKDPNHITSCDINPLISCGTVMKSAQAHLFGFPNPFIGIVAFGIIITVGASLLSGARFARWYWLAVNAGIALGFIFCVWLWSQAVYVIGALCIYCMIVWAVMIVLLVHTTVRNLTHGVIPASPRVVAIAQDAAWPVAVLLAIGVVVSIFLRFAGMFIH